MKVTILLGSVRTGRQSHKVAYYLEKMLQKRGIATDLIDLAKDPLPMYGDQAEQPLQLGQNIERISKRLQEGDALLFVTPEYHGSFSGVLKNALDHYWAQFHKKPIGVVAVSSGKKGGINASTQLQHVILSLGAFPLPLKLLVPEVHLAFNESLELFRENIVQHTHKFLDEFLWFAQAIVKAKSIPEKRVA
jgi:NAD(P)H-dependent FMN reductase